MKKAFRVGTVEAAPGSVGKGYIPFGYLSDSTPVEIPVILVNGLHEGPTLWISSTMHGIEIGGAEVIRRITREIIDPANLKGQIVAWPILNPLAYRDAMTNTPQDLVNINRIYPGHPSGTTTHRLANRIVEFLPVADYVIDFHANVLPSLVHAIIKPAPDLAVRAKSLEMAKAFGVTILFAQAHIESSASGKQVMGGSLTEITIMEGKPTVTVELIDSRRLHPAAVESCVRGVQNVMLLLGMIKGAYLKQDTVKVIPGIFSRPVITADKGGLVELVKDAGDPVQKGEVFVRIRNPFGDVVDEVKSPVSGYVLAYPMQKNQAVATGDYVAFLITPFTGDIMSA